MILDPLRELVRAYRRARQGTRVVFDYAYSPRERHWQEAPGPKSLSRLIEAGRSRYVETLREFSGLIPELSEIPLLPGQCRSGREPCWENNWIPALDSIALCGLLRKYRPRTYLEIGSGNSTKFARWAIERYGLPTRIVSIDPQPRAEVDALCDEVIRSRCEEAPASVFARLGDSDLLFVDNSHRAFPNSDVTVFFMEILPALAPGVVYGIHDIFLPDDYPEAWAPRMYNEQYLLAAYLLGGADGDEVLLPNAWITRTGLNRALDALWNNPRLAGMQSSGVAFWMTRRGKTR